MQAESHVSSADCEFANTTRLLIVAKKYRTSVWKLYFNIVPFLKNKKNLVYQYTQAFELFILVSVVAVQAAVQIFNKELAYKAE